jgi:hypothetical protein
MTLPISDRQAIIYLLMGMDEEETRTVLKDVLNRSWVK